MGFANRRTLGTQNGRRRITLERQNKNVFPDYGPHRLLEAALDTKEPEFGSERVTLSYLQKRAHQTAIDKGWWENDKDGRPRTFGDQMALMHSEISECLEAFRRNGDPMEKWYREDGKPEGTAIEMGDCVIRILDTCEAYGLDLTAAMLEKMDWNDGREHRHGGKAL